MDDSIRFTKMSATGNDFIVFDNRSGRFTGDEKQLFSTICRRRISVGADGVILVEKGESAPVRMRYFNSDGRESTMCGNGARCVGYYAVRKRIVKGPSFRLEAGDGEHTLSVQGDAVSVSMRPPMDVRMNIGIERRSIHEEAGFVDTGVPHYVLWVDDADSVNVKEIGKYYRHHRAFLDGTNVDFVELLGNNRIRLRTYERGVEAETLSCGTGCVASAYFSALLRGYTSPVTVITAGGDLEVRFNETWEEAALIATATIVYEGKLRIPVN